MMKFRPYETLKGTNTIKGELLPYEERKSLLRENRAEGGGGHSEKAKLERNGCGFRLWREVFRCVCVCVLVNWIDQEKGGVYCVYIYNVQKRPQ